jgi:hypothetical protein
LVAGLTIFAHVGGLPPSGNSARGGAKKSITSVFAKPSLVLYTRRNDHDVALAADPLFVVEANSIIPLSIQTICSLG